MNLDEKDVQIAKIALDHARAMTLHASELRMKNFNFFLVIAGVIVAAHLKLGKVELPIALAGATASLAFLVLDVRGKRLLASSKIALVSAEAALRISPAPTTEESLQQGEWQNKLISHTFVYRTLYVLGFLASISLIF